MINWWAVMVVAAFNMFLGSLWYGPLFGRRWMALMNMNREDLESGSNPLTYVVPLAGAVVSALVLAVLLNNMRVYAWWAGAAWGSLLWFAFGATGLLTTGTFESTPRARSWLFIGYMEIVHAVGGAILVLWR